jgi:ferredoxin-NADP reductase
MEYKVKILMIEFVTHDVKRFVLEKPKNYKFMPGQATLISINKKGWEDKRRPFTFTSLNSSLVLEFTIKGYKRGGVTEELHKLKAGDELVIREPFGTINYQGKGVFIAGGAGITPFIAIIRQLKEDKKLWSNRLIFSNKTKKDILLEKELVEAFGNDLILTLTDEKVEGYRNELINKDFLRNNIKDFKQNFYVCGPSQFVSDIKKALQELGASAEALIFEGKF